MRGMYCAEDGMVLLEGDYAQQELRVMYAVAGDEVLGRNLATGDVYTEDAKGVFQLSADMKRCKCEGPCQKPDLHVKASARQTCKVVHLTGQYGGGARRVHEVILEEDRRAKFSFTSRVFDGMWHPRTGTYRGTVAYWEREMERVLSIGYSESRILGRRLYYPRPPVGDRSRVANYPIQSTAADMTTLAEIALDDRLEGFVGEKWAHPCYQIMNQHDCLILEVKDDPTAIRDCALLLREVMGQAFVIDGKEWRFPIDLKIGKVWDGIKDFHDRDYMEAI